jgi:hypothetical protein
MVKPRPSLRPTLDANREKKKKKKKKKKEKKLVAQAISCQAAY